MGSTIYERIYKRLETLGVPQVEEYKKRESEGFMPLHIDRLGKWTWAISHTYTQNGDVIPDPDMEVRIYQDAKMAEAMTYQDAYGFRAVYPEPEKVDIRAKKELNDFLEHWLGNLVKQGFCENKLEKRR